MIALAPWHSVRSFIGKRKAHCKNCDGFFSDNILPIGGRRITLKQSFNRTLYLCIPCAEFEAQKLEKLVHDIRRAMEMDIDTEKEFYERMASNA
jgi:hypothetical protein